MVVEVAIDEDSEGKLATEKNNVILCSNTFVIFGKRSQKCNMTKTKQKTVSKATARRHK